jgi:hypothetical protein
MFEVRWIIARDGDISFAEFSVHVADARIGNQFKAVCGDVDAVALKEMWFGRWIVVEEERGMISRCRGGWVNGAEGNWRAWNVWNSQ